MINRHGQSGKEATFRNKSHFKVLNADSTYLDVKAEHMMSLIEIYLVSEKPSVL